DLVEASYTFNYGYGTSIYTGAQRYSLKNFNIAQHKLELNGDNFNLKAYGTFEDSGESYIADFVGFSVNDAYLANETWFGTYGGGVAAGIIQAALQAQGGDPSFNPGTVGAILSDPSLVSQFHMGARNAADANRYAPGSTSFNTAKEATLQSTIPNGALFDDNSRFYHVEGQYNFKNEIRFVDLLAGLSYRQFQLRSNGTIFDDAGGGIDINEWGAYLQASRPLLDDNLKLTGSIRYDKNENFDGQFSPRLSAVARIFDQQNIRASFQTGFRNPTTQGQYIDLNVVTAQLLGGLPRFANKYSITQSSYTYESVLEFQNEVLAGNPNAAAELVPFDSYSPVKPEQIQAFEVGYKGLLGNKLFIDAAYYYNIYDDFITQIRVRQINSDINDNGSIESNEIFSPTPSALPLLLSGDHLNTFQIYTNTTKTVKAQGAVFGLEYSLPAGYRLGFNYNWNQLISDLGTFQNDFNTPEHKVNVSFGNRRLTDRLGFNLAWRWQDAFRWESSFAFADVPAVSTLDAQLNYLLPQYNATIKLGGSNLFNEQYVLSGGGPNIGAIYYVSLTFDQLFR
ncbi:MAG: TonB-dependent receptor, partial [Balneolaceae bacterium]|nr:TonB-dependent receptor [Balneolaceae bacterium]